ncbi:MAG: hypothetical protein ACPGJS_23290 [Flammeovirgaceae bacterium]
MLQHQLRHLLLLTFCTFITHVQAQDVITPDKQAEKRNFRQQTAQGMLYAGTNFGLGIGLQSSSVSVADAQPLIDGVSNTKLGVFPIPRLLVGANFDFAGAMVIQGDPGESERELVLTKTIGPFVRYYLSKSIFAEGQYGWGSGEERNGDATPEPEEFSAQRYVVGVGLAQFWGKRIAFELMARYSGIQGDVVYLGNIGVTAGIGVTIGQMP